MATAKRRRKTSAPGQAYGYLIQVVRVLWHLLRASPGDVVAFETLGDVSVESEDGVLSEEDKSGLAHNPIADGSLALWKTFANWADARRDGTLPAGCKYLLYVAQRHEGAIVQCLSDCQTLSAAKELVAILRERLFPVTPSENESDTDDGKTLKAELRRLFSHSDDAIASIVIDFTLEKATAAPFDEVRAEIARSTSDENVDAVSERLLGWVKRQLMMQVESRLPVRVCYDDFRKQRLNVLRRIDRNQNAFPEHDTEPTREEIKEQLVDRLYVRQLSLLELDDDDIEQHVRDYIRASAARTAWSEIGYLDRNSFRKYESELTEHWRLCRMVLKSDKSEKSSITRGVELLFNCLSRTARLETIEVPSYFSRGSFHAMADEPRIGWHPDWEVLLGLEAGRANKNAD